MPAQHWIVSDAEAGQKLLQFLQRRLADDAPRSVLMRWMRTGQVRVDGGRAKPFQRLNAGQTVRVPPFAQENTKPPPVAGSPNLDILHEDSELLVVNKPSGLAMHPGSGQTDSLTDRLAAAYTGADFAPTPAHRLDKATSGLVLVAKSYRRLAQLHEWMREGKLDKRYLAWVRGQWPNDSEFELRDELAKIGEKGVERVGHSEKGKAAVCRVVPMRRMHAPEETLLEIRLITGRTHQIRAQLSLRGYPIVGDRKYGAHDPDFSGPMLLHAWRIEAPDGAWEAAPNWHAVNEGKYYRCK